MRTLMRRNCVSFGMSKILIYQGIDLLKASMHLLRMNYKRSE